MFWLFRPGVRCGGSNRWDTWWQARSAESLIVAALWHEQEKSRKHFVPNNSMPTMDIRGQLQTNQGQDLGHQQNFNSFSSHLDSHRGLMRPPFLERSGLSRKLCRYSPLDFRWFMGRHKLLCCNAVLHPLSQVQCNPRIWSYPLLHAVALGSLNALCDLKEPVLRDLSTQDFGWVSVACARPVALKQCLGLPKPLWHEAGKGHAENSEKHFKRYSKDAMMETPFPGDGTLWRWACGIEQCGTTQAEGLGLFDFPIRPCWCMLTCWYSSMPGKRSRGQKWIVRREKKLRPVARASIINLVIFAHSLTYNCSLERQLIHIWYFAKVV